MKLKRFRNKFISMLLTLAMLLTLFPTAVFAEDTAADRPASAELPNLRSWDCTLSGITGGVCPSSLMSQETTHS